MLLMRTSSLSLLTLGLQVVSSATLALMGATNDSRTTSKPCIFSNTDLGTQSSEAPGLMVTSPTVGRVRCAAVRTNLALPVIERPWMEQPGCSRASKSATVQRHVTPPCLLKVLTEAPLSSLQKTWEACS